MKVIKYLFLSMSVCLLFAAMAFAQQTETTKKNYLNLEIEKFTVRAGVEFPADKLDPLTKGVIDNMRKSKRFTQVSASGETVTATTENGDTRTLRISGEVIKYVKGNRAARYIVGMGVGATKIIADIKFVDARTGEVVLQQTVDGDVTWGVFGGDSDDAKSGVADEIIRIMKKNGMAGEKIKTKK
jgi:hypothetical protein